MLKEQKNIEVTSVQERILILQKLAHFQVSIWASSFEEKVLALIRLHALYRAF